MGLGTVLLFKSLKEVRLEGVRIARIPWAHHLFFCAQVPGISRARLYWQVARGLRR